MKNRILFVDDDKFILDTFRRTFRDLDITLCDSPIKALEMMREEAFDVVVSDYKMPKMDGVEFIRRAAETNPNSVRIMLTGNADLDIAVRAVNEGSVFKFLQKPCDRNILRKTVEQAMEKFNSEKELRDASEENYYKATHDSLTGLANRFMLQEKAGDYIDNWNRYQKRFALFYMDLDKFKPINDTYGHHIGDEVLKEVAARLLKTVRATDTVARLGGDEFVILAENVKTEEEAGALAKKIITAVTCPIYTNNDLALEVGISIGISIYPEHAEQYKLLLEEADACVYKSKEKGGSAFTVGGCRQEPQ
ncbi:two-component system response regulator [Geovibrio ferrireducens]|uniref:two-component system response regulator n=1 Tax=Geovibrio ferrireducens TaxID=46201 RepID=UPI002247B1CC|nr:diguanylate cyclase [Geovibrio ferrireducens]